MAEVNETNMTRRVWRNVMVSLTAFGIAAGLASCALVTPAGTSPGTNPGTEQTTAAPAPSKAPAPTTPPASEATIAVSPENGTDFVNPVSEIVAEVSDGTVVSAILSETKSGVVTDGELSVSDSKWVSNKPLKFDMSYTFNVTAVDAGGTQSNQVSTFTTVPPSHEANAVLYPNADAQVGVAQPLQWSFSEPVLNKEAIENAIKVTTSTGQTGAFRWYSDTLLRYRAADYWPANSALNVDMQLFGLDFGNGMIGNFNKNYNVNIGNKVVMEADAAAHSVSVLVNDQVVQTYPATLGDADFPSASGYMVVTGDFQRYATFKASTIGLNPGDPGDYGSVDVEHAIRLSNSGIFIHQATDTAMPYLGTANLSHGCIGLGPDAAAWVFANLSPGDIVHTVGTPNETIAPTDGFGDWNIPFEQYASR